MPLTAVLVWLIAAAAVVALWRLRGGRAVRLLLACLFAVVLCVVVWNILGAFRAVH
jgi:hypothetical protein